MHISQDPIGLKGNNPNFYAHISDPNIEFDLFGLSTYKKPKSGSGKEKATDVPGWAKGNRPYTTENGNQFATRLCDDHFGKGEFPKGPKSDFNKIKKWGDRGFE